MGFSLKSPLGIGLASAALTLALCLGLGVILIERTQRRASESRALEMELIQARYNDEFRAFADRLLVTVESTDQKITEAMGASEDALFLNDAEQQAFEQERIDALAKAVSERLNAAAVTNEEAGEMQGVVERVSERISPILNEISQTGTMTRSDIQLYTHRISEQITTVLREEIEAKQQLNNNLLVSTGIARDSIALSGEMAALYVSSMKDSGMVSRLLMLPVNLVQDAASMSIIGSSDRKKAEERIFAELTALHDRLNEVEASMPVVMDISPPAVAIPAPAPKENEMKKSASD